MPSLSFVLYAGFGLPLWASLAYGQIFIGSNSSETSFPATLPGPQGISSTCNSTFSTDVTCDRNLPSIAFGGYFPDSMELDMLCNTDCLQSLEALRNSQQRSCASDVMVLAGMAYPVTATTDALVWTYNYTCRRDSSTGQFCAPIFDAWANGNASDKACSDCVLGTYQIHLASPLGYNSDQAANFSSLTSSCHATGYPITSPPPNTVSLTRTSTSTTTSPAASKSCASRYTVQSGDNCHSISTAQKVSTNGMLYLNNLEGGCTHFPTAGAELCMPHTCDIYTVQQNDTCYGIAESHNATFTISQLVSWNIDINRGCENLELLVGNQICVSFPGDTPVVTVTAPASTATIAPVPSNVVQGTNTRCSKYYEVRGGDTCASVTQILGISLDDFYFLNPEINSTSCNNLFLGYSYCVQAVGDINTYPGYGGSPTNPCVGGTSVGASSCYANTYSTAPAWTFPVVNTTGGVTSTSNWTSHPVTTVTAYPNTISPAPTPNPHQDGMITGCTQFYNVHQGDTCYDLAQRWSISLDTLYSWNPALHNDCSGLQLGVYICVRVGSTTYTTPTSTTSSTTTTTGGGGSPPPGPTQNGIPPDCNRWVMQKDGVYCYDMANNAGISLSCLYQLNPALNTSAGECQGLWPGYAYCVGTASRQCT